MEAQTWFREKCIRTDKAPRVEISISGSHYHPWPAGAKK